MFIALYRWKIKPGREAVFQEGWRRITLEIREKRGGWGSRLHKAEDGTFIAYAQWKNQETREAAFKIPALDTDAAEMMNSSIEERFPAVYMSVAEDLLLHEFEE